MTNLIKLAIPLIDQSLTLKDISKEMGFVDAYFEDINRPYLDYHIFLLYDANAKGVGVYDTMQKLKGLASFYGLRVIYINKKPYYLYTFTSNTAIDNLHNGRIWLNENNKLRVLQFWQFKDCWVSTNVMRGTMACEPDRSSVPEEDYQPEFKLGQNDKGGTLVLSAPPFLRLYRSNNHKDT